MSEPESGDKNPRDPRNPDQKEFLTPRVRYDRWVTPPPEGWVDGFNGGYASDRQPAAGQTVAGPPASIPREHEQKPAPAQVGTTPEKKKGILSIRKIMRDVVLPLLIAFVVAMFAQATIAKPYQIPTGSMLPTIQLEDRILANRLVYRLHEVERGDVIVFTPPPGVNADTPYVKRVIGLPGDRVKVENGVTYVNDQPYVVPTASAPTYRWPEQQVPEGSLFVLGDNRDNSADSHIWGFARMDDVIGRAEIVYWPPGNAHLLGD